MLPYTKGRPDCASLPLLISECDDDTETTQLGTPLPGAAAG